MPFVRAVYDNDAETDDELSFRRGDVMALVEIDADGMEGWWRCTLRDRTGLAPANRLKLITETKCPVVAMLHFSSIQTERAPTTDYDVPQSVTPDAERSLASLHLAPPRVTSHSSSERDSDYDTPSSLTPDLDSSTPQQDEHQWKTTTTGRPGNVIAKLFKGNKRGGSDDQEAYDVPMPSKWEKEKQKSDKFGMTKRNEETRENDARWAQKDRRTFVERDSCMADYDVPSGRETSQTKMQSVSPSRSEEGLSDRESTDYDVPLVSSARLLRVAQQQLSPNSTPVKAKIADSDRNRNKTVTPSIPNQVAREGSKSPANASTSMSEDLLATFKLLHKETSGSFQKIIDGSGTWRECKNVVTRASIVRLSCVAAWKALQDMIICVSKIAARYNGVNRISFQLQTLKEKSDILENVIEFLTAATKPTDALEKSKYDYLTSLVEQSSDIKKLLELLETILEDEKKGIHVEENLSHKPDIIITRALDAERNNSSRVNIAVQKLAPPTTPKPGYNIVKSASSSNLLDVPKSPKAVTSSTKPHANESRQPMVRSMDSILTDAEDYDNPRPAAGGLTTNNALDSRMREDRDLTPQLRWNAANEAFETKRGKRGAVVMDKGDKQFDILLRRHSDSKISPFKMVAGSVVAHGGDLAYAGRMEKDEVEDAVDYDYPMPSAEEESHGHVPIADRQLLNFYAPSILEETRKLKICNTEIFHKMNDDVTHNAQTFLFLARAILVSAHKLTFIGDTLLRNLIQSDLRKRIQLHCKELGRGNDLMTVIISTKTAAAGDGKSVQGRQRLFESSRCVLEAALKFAEIVLRSR